MDSSSALRFTVIGNPIPQGSTRAFIPKGWNRPIITAANSKTKPWRQEIAGCALAEMKKQGFSQCGKNVPVTVGATFYFEKPKSAGKRVLHKVTKPDLDKLLRSALDALTGIVFVDDSQVTECRIAKRFGSPARMEIMIEDGDELPPAVNMVRPILDADIAF